ncbi:MAG: hypothetical protein NTX91_01130 [candidate division SR1 bacterium]|nr:hypothetical protein [candidate division SR1 bacterium]
MKKVIKNMLLTSSIQINKDEVIKGTENNTMGSLDIEVAKVKVLYNTAKKKWRRRKNIYLALYSIVAIIGLLGLCIYVIWPEVKLTIGEKIVAAIVVFIVEFLGACGVEEFNSSWFKKTAWFKKFDTDLKKRAVQTFGVKLEELYVQMLSQIFLLDLEKRFAFAYSYPETKVRIGNYTLECFLEGQNREDNSWFRSFFDYDWNLEFSNGLLPIVPPSMDSSSLFIKKIYLNGKNMVCILLEGEVLSHEFSGFDQAKIVSKEYVEIWEG